MAALSGCITTTALELCGHQDAEIGMICNDSNMMHYGLRLERLRPVGNTAYWCPNRDPITTPTPWLFSISDLKGYINFFAEEFCYDHSPYVTQGEFKGNFGRLFVAPRFNPIF